MRFFFPMFTEDVVFWGCFNSIIVTKQHHVNNFLVLSSIFLKHNNKPIDFGKITTKKFI